MFRGIDRWFAGYLASLLIRPRHVDGERHLLFCVADHFEPFRKRLDRDGNVSGGRDRKDAVALVKEWTRAYRRFADGLADADGVPPRHTFFYPAEEYDEECLDVLTEFCAGGFGDVEIHLHHRNDTAEGLRNKLECCRETLRSRHGLLGSDAEDRVRYGFVHGNWSLCNSRPDGDWCGVNEELGILSETGCYADFTFPSAPSPTQPKMVNAIYRAVDTPGRPRGQDAGVRSQVSGVRPDADSLLLVQGPLALDWGRRKWGVVPRLDNAEISGSNLPTPGRARLWMDTGIHVRGRPEWIFVKVHTHGCVDANRRALFGGAARAMHEYLGKGDGGAWKLHYVTAREMYNIVRGAEKGREGDPASLRDEGIAPPDAFR